MRKLIRHFERLLVGFGVYQTLLMESAQCLSFLLYYKRNVLTDYSSNNQTDFFFSGNVILNHTHTHNTGRGWTMC